MPLDRLFEARHPARRTYRNKPLRAAIADSGAYMYEVAAQLGIDESTLYRWLRRQLPEQKIVAILRAAEDLAKEHGKTDIDVICTFRDHVDMELAEAKVVPWEDKSE